ncbi:MAG: type I-B CRISPR-associated protein Cas8b/Csh1 [Lachnospiraceae bacterium]|nr:type I-B CRISPR-associated protein Cas8b/Csh1 [Lachnospiraceae bacterium]
MLGECLEIFGSYTEEKRESDILDHYIPKDGTYILITKDGRESVTDIKLDKKTGQVSKSADRYQDFCYYDYHSDLVSMNKSLDPNKIIHSNNYLSFWVKKESILNGKLTTGVINEYYDILEHPEKKYGKTAAMPIYESLEAEIGKVDTEALKRNRQWILDHIFCIESLDKNIDLRKKDYLKIFFEADREVYRREGNRYLIPNIYNSNQYNVIVKGKTYGLPDNNQGMNAKKPFLSIKTRKSAAPYLLEKEDAILQKQFFDYLMNFAAVGEFNIYVDQEKKKFSGCKNDGYPIEPLSGFYLRIQKGKEVEIRDQDVVPFFDNHLKKPFVYENKLEIEDEKNPEHEFGKVCETFKEVEWLINDVFFSKMLVNNYFSEEADIKITEETVKRMLLLSRRKLFGWLHLGNAAGIRDLIDRISRELIIGSILNEHMLKAAKQINLRMSLMQYLSEGGEEMADFSMELRENLKLKICSDEYQGLESDREYYFAVGQLARYFIFLSKAGKKKQSLINPFLNARTDAKLKELLGKLYKKYNYDIPVGVKRVSRLYGMIECYEPVGQVMQDMVSAGFVIDNLILEKKGKEEKEDE